MRRNLILLFLMPIALMKICVINIILSVTLVEDFPYVCIRFKYWLSSIVGSVWSVITPVIFFTVRLIPIYAFFVASPYMLSLLQVAQFIYCSFYLTFYCNSYIYRLYFFNSTFNKVVIFNQENKKLNWMSVGYFLKSKVTSN